MGWIKFYLKNPLTLYLQWMLTHFHYRIFYKNVVIHLNTRVNKSQINNNVHLYENTFINNSSIGEYTYISQNASISNTTIGRYCSVGPNVIIAPGKHPTNLPSTSPVFYSTRMQVGVSTNSTETFEEVSPVFIGNDVWIGANSIILDGVKIGDGSIIAANSVVTRTIPEFTIVGGSPAKFIKDRFPEETLQKVRKSKWWEMTPKQAQHLMKKLK